MPNFLRAKYVPTSCLSMRSTHKARNSLRINICTNFLWSTQSLGVLLENSARTTLVWCLNTLYRCSVETQTRRFLMGYSMWHRLTTSLPVHTKNVIDLLQIQSSFESNIAKISPWSDRSSIRKCWPSSLCSKEQLNHTLALLYLSFNQGAMSMTFCRLDAFDSDYPCFFFKRRFKEPKSKCNRITRIVFIHAYPGPNQTNLMCQLFAQGADVCCGCMVVVCERRSCWRVQHGTCVWCFEERQSLQCQTPCPSCIRHLWTSTFCSSTCLPKASTQTRKPWWKCTAFVLFQTSCQFLVYISVHGQRSWFDGLPMSIDLWLPSVY